MVYSACNSNKLINRAGFEMAELVDFAFKTKKSGFLSTQIIPVKQIL